MLCIDCRGIKTRRNSIEMFTHADPVTVTLTSKTNGDAVVVATH